MPYRLEREISCGRGQSSYRSIHARGSRTQRVQPRELPEVASLIGKTPEGWSATGTSVADGFASVGDFTINPEGGKALKNVLPQGFYTNFFRAG